MVPPSLTPRAASELDYQVGLPRSVEAGTVVLFEPRLPARERYAPDQWAQIVARYDERWREWWGPMGDAVRARAGVVQPGVRPEGWRRSKEVPR